MAHARGISMAQLVTEILSKETAMVQISARDYEAIAKATKEAEQTGKRIATKLDDPA
jgi:hypothetical protein